FTDRAAGKKIEQLIRHGIFGAVVCDFLAPSLTFPRKLWGQTILFQHNVETVLWDRMLASEPSRLKRLLYRVEAGRMRRYECSSVGKFQHVIAVSEQDRAYMSQFMPADKISVVPTGVDLERYRSTSGGQATEPLVMFTGTM